MKYVVVNFSMSLNQCDEHENIFFNSCHGNDQINMFLTNNSFEAKWKKKCLIWYQTKKIERHRRSITII